MKIIFSENCFIVGCKVVKHYAVLWVTALSSWDWKEWYKIEYCLLDLKNTMYLDFILVLTRTSNQTGLNLSPRKKSIKGDRWW